MLKFGAEARKQLENISNAGERIDCIDGDRKASCLKTLADQGQALTAKRKAAAAQLEQDRSRPNWTT